MREMGIKAQWIKPFTTTTGNSDFSTELTNILDEHLTRNAPMPYGAQILLIYGLKMALSTLIVSWTCLPEKS